MLSLQLFTHPRINNSKIPSRYTQKTLSSLDHYSNVKSRKYGSNNLNNFSPNSSPFRFYSAAAATNDSRTWGSDNNEEKSSAMKLAEGLQAELMPNHVAVLMDGHRRWAAKRNLPIELSHRAEAEAIKRLVMSSFKLGIKVLTLFVMSTENYKRRPQEEIDSLEKISNEIAIEIHELMRHGVKISVIGDTKKLPRSMHPLISSAEATTKQNKGMHLVLALNYGGRYDITEASKKIARKVEDGVLRVEDVDETVVEQHLETGGFEFPHPRFSHKNQW